ncbi:MAG: coproporphyrinogen dehydrogenase HemZ [Oscillospiraceae bacterium]|nr:coproporphyrinogen dehydrogenase HemZ [Oscillospiraceae bacterium]
MTLYLVNHRFHYELETLCRLFFPFEKITAVFSDPEAFQTGDIIVTRLELNGDKYVIYADLRFGGEWSSAQADMNTSEGLNECERVMAVLLFRQLVQFCKFTPRWGILTGVRPAKLFARLASGQGSEAARWAFSEKLLVAPEKIDLCAQVNERQAPVLATTRPESFSLYVAVPFCPTRCRYCSFVSHTVERAGRLTEDYALLLCRELETTARIAKELGLRLESVYIGGGTPTFLSVSQLERVMVAISVNFDLAHAAEYTVEAGRPDTVTAEKLEVIKRQGGVRISINPQTLSDSVLAAIGRQHTVAEFYQAFNLARRLEFCNINTDIIAGLPTDTSEGFSQTLAGLFELAPESITVHTLAVKKASFLAGEIGKSGEYTDPPLRHNAQINRYLALANHGLNQCGYVPYYLYRQSKTAGNAENVGWCKPGREGFYNIIMMEEAHTVLACGAGAVTKLKEPGGNRIERIFNYKYPYEYISRFDEILRRKEKITEFYKKTQGTVFPVRFTPMDRENDFGGKYDRFIF